MQFYSCTAIILLLALYVAADNRQYLVVHNEVDQSLNSTNGKVSERTIRKGGMCPPLKPSQVGTCVDACRPLGSFCPGPGGKICCPNGCGRVCMDPYKPRCNDSWTGPGKQARQTKLGDNCPDRNLSACARVRCGNCTKCVVTATGRALCVADHDACCKGQQYFCLVNPCRVLRCDKHPNATCVANYCDGCNAVFYDDAGKQITDCVGNMLGLQKRKA